MCLTESMVTLQWIRRSVCQWKTFVANRVAKIKSTRDPWRHCSGEDNPADFLTRGLPAKVLAVNNLRWSGSSWLSSQCLPDQRELPIELSESVEKERKHTQTRACAAIAKEPVIDPCRYERWLTLVRVAAHAFRGVLYFQVKKKFRFQRTVSREVTRRQVILVTTDTMGGVPSRV